MEIVGPTKGLGRGPRLRLDYPHAKIELVAASGKKRARACEKEPFTVEWLESLGDADVLYDIGANVGSYSLIAAKARGARVVAFEPASASYAVLCENIRANDASSIIAIPVALAATSGLTTFRYASMRPGAAHHNAEGRTVYEQPMPAFRLDDLVTLLELPRPTHLKIDVDGAEVDILAGATATLAGASVRSVLAELRAGDDRAAGILEAAGFGLAGTYDRGRAGSLRYALFNRA